MTPSRIQRLSLTHFRNYRAASVQAIRRALKPGGYAVMPLMGERPEPQSIEPRTRLPALLRRSAQPSAPSDPALAT